MKKLWEQRDFKKVMLQKLTEGREIRPTTLERRVIEIIKKYNIPLEYTGDGSLWIGNPPMNPDFVYKDRKAVVEVFGDYWHTPDEEKKRMEFFQKYGYLCLVLWEHELKSQSDEQIAKRLEEFGCERSGF